MMTITQEVSSRQLYRFRLVMSVMFLKVTSVSLLLAVALLHSTTTAAPAQVSSNTCPDGSDPVTCHLYPCQSANCPSFNTVGLRCESYRCGGCNIDRWFLTGVDLEVTTLCPLVRVKLRSQNFPDRFLGASENEGRLVQDGPLTQWKLVPGLCSERDTISFESRDKPGHYLRHKNLLLYLETNDGTNLFRQDACFHQHDNQFFDGFAAFESVNFPNFYIRHFGFRLRISKNVASDALLKVDSSFKIESVFWIDY